MKLISIGCSFLYGYYKRGEGCNKDYSAGYHLSNMMGRDWLNESDCGIGNDLICERLITSHQSNKINPKDTFVLIGWTEAFRKKIFVNDKVYIDFRPPVTLSDKGLYDIKDESLYSEYFMNSNQIYYDFLKNILTSYYLLENYGYKYFMFDSINTMHDGSHNLLDDYTIGKEWIPQEFVNVKNEIKNYSKLNYFNYLKELEKDNDFPYCSREDLHPNQYGAKSFAKKLYKEINK
mgnify:FL=1